MASSLKTQLLRLRTCNRYITRRKLSLTSVLSSTPQPEPEAKPLSIPQPDGELKIYSPKLEQIFQSISQLNLLEVAELSELLKKRLNLPDAPIMSVGAIPVAVADTEKDEVPEMVQTSFTVKLTSFNADQKVTLIKELKNLLPDLNLVQAKKLIESAPTVVSSNIGKDEADKIKEALVKAGGEVVIE